MPWQGRVRERCRGPARPREGGHERRRFRVSLGRMALAVALIASGTEAPPAGACSCRWLGPFVTVARQSPVILRGVVQRQGGTSRVGPRWMELEVEEVFKGGRGEKRVIVFGGDGMLCRPEVSRFPVGSQWVLALDGPGSKPGVEGGHALSACGTSWLEVADGEVAGNVDDELDETTVQRVSLADFRARLARALAGPARVVETFTAEVNAGQPFSRRFGERFELLLVPVACGWRLEVREEGRDEDLARLTPPFHFVPNDREIEGWHFRNTDNTGPNEPGEKNVNAPGPVRRFIFSPEVGATVGAGQAAITEGDIERVAAFGQGRLEILDYRLTNLEPGEQAAFEWVRFTVALSYPAATGAPPR